MNVRVIAGKYGGRTIAAPGRRSTHAMSQRIRNAVFNSLAGRVAEASVLDAFAGSGGVGIEALSRGAKKCLFIERDHVAARIIQKNLDLLGADEDGRVISTTVSNWLSTADPQLFDLIFADPPYHDTQLNTVLRLVDLLTSEGRMIISLPYDQELPAVKGVVVVDERIYGNAKLITVTRR
ncbi:MAG: 16S rRNA (guanine(966)-N(2))-methyltransferase RsmD [Patescibacteria group bacterium]